MKKIISHILLFGTVIITAVRANAAELSDCVGAQNLSGVDVVVRLSDYPGWSWSMSAGDRKVIWFKTSNGIVVSRDWKNRNPVPYNVEPAGSIGSSPYSVYAPPDVPPACSSGWVIVILNK